MRGSEAGFDDVLVGAPQAEHGHKAEGLAVVFYGGKDGLSNDQRGPSMATVQTGAWAAW